MLVIANWLAAHSGAWLDLGLGALAYNMTQTLKKSQMTQDQLLSNHEARIVVLEMAISPTVRSIQPSK